MNTRIYENHEKMSISAANYISEYINSNPDSLLCFAAGDTPQETFARLIEMQKNGKVDLSKAYYVGLDEWWGLGYETKGSCIQVMMDNFYFSFDYGQGFGSLITSAIHSGQIDRHFSADFLIGVLALFFSNIHKLLPPHSSSTEALTTLDQIIDLIQYGILSKKGETE
jgi:hypothetical protein